MKYQKLVVPDPHMCVFRTTCDFCGGEIPPYNDVEITALEGDIWPEYDGRERTEIDCCLDCFQNKVVTTLEKKYGVLFRTRMNHDRNGAYARIVEEEEA